MKTNLTSLLIVGVCLLMPAARAAEPVPPAKPSADAADSPRVRAAAALSPEAFTYFDKEIKKTYPEHVTAYRIFRAKITRVRETRFCNGRTALCGENPTCGHPVTPGQVLEFTPQALVFTSKAAMSTVPKLKESSSRRQTQLAVGDSVLISAYTYTSGLTSISKVMKDTPTAAK